MHHHSVPPTCEPTQVHVVAKFFTVESFLVVFDQVVEVGVSSYFGENPFLLCLFQVVLRPEVLVLRQYFLLETLTVSIFALFLAVPVRLLHGEKGRPEVLAVERSFHLGVELCEVLVLHGVLSCDAFVGVIRQQFLE